MAVVPDSNLLITPTAAQGLVKYEKTVYEHMAKHSNLRAVMEGIDREYARENNSSDAQRRAKQANANGDKSKIQELIVPVIMPQVESSLAYLAGVFLQGYPIFSNVAPPEYADAALQMDAIIADQSTRGGWVTQFLLYFLDGLKYNLQAMECSWELEKTWGVTTSKLSATHEAQAQEQIWAGNRLRRWDLYNTLWDTRVNPTEVHTKGEFAATTTLMSRVALNQFLHSLPDAIRIKRNYKPAMESSLGEDRYFHIPEINPDALISPTVKGEFNWAAWATNSHDAAKRINYQNAYEVTKLYARVVPSDFGINVPFSGTPQIWKLYYVNHKFLVAAERQTNAHNYLPVIFGQPKEDGLGCQTKSMAKNLEPIQNLASAFAIAKISSTRRAISDRMLYDPRAVSSDAINNPSATAKIPVRPNAYNKSLSELVHQIPYRDDAAVTLMQDLSMVVRMGDDVTGSNPSRRGQFVKGNKTRKEFEDTQGNSTGRDQLQAVAIEHQTMTPIKEMLKINILQYQPPKSLLAPDNSQVVKVNPLTLREAIMTFKVSDGLLPADKIMSTEDFGAALNTLSTVPQLGQAYHIAPLFTYIMKSRGADLRPFEKTKEELLYDQQLQSWQQVALEAIKAGKEPPPQPQPPQQQQAPNPTGA